MKKIAIVGAGFSGTVTAINLLRQAQALKIPISVILIDTRESFGKGLAYSTEDDNLVLNVPIGNMSAFPDKPDDFQEFCTGLDSSLVSGAFVFRRVYGEYLKTRLDEAKSANADKLTEIKDYVTGLRQEKKIFTLTLQSGAAVTSDIVILAFGHSLPRPLSETLGEGIVDNDISKDIYLNNPWDISALDRLPVDKSVLIVGTGHTAIDTLFRLVSCSSPRKIYLVSRHGHTPKGHRQAGEFVKIQSVSIEVENIIRQILAVSPTIRKIFSAVRTLIKHHVELKGNWRDVINSLRPITPEIWKALPFRERARFLRHIVHHWDVLRHRLAPVAMRRLEGLLTAGRVEIIAGKISKLKSIPNNNEISVGVKLRGSGLHRELIIGSVVNCTGPNYNINYIGNPLVRQLVENKLLQQDEAKIGFLVDENYRCSQTKNIFYIGPMLKSMYWEAIAIPELRVHSDKLAKTIIASV